MKKGLDAIMQFIIDTAAKGDVTLEEYLKLTDTIFELDEKKE